VEGLPDGELPCQTFAEAVARWRPRVYRLAVARSGGDSALAEDVCQEVLFNLHRRAGGGKPPHPLAPLIGSLYKGAINNALRSRRRRRIDGEPESERMPTSQTPERQLQEAEEDLLLQRDVAAIFAEMDPWDVELIQMSRGHGVPVQEIAAFFGRPEGTVTSRLCRARRTLLECYQRRKLSRR
jgi:RNA polymerase sigma factor (sigma-70 family)